MSTVTNNNGTLTINNNGIIKTLNPIEFKIIEKIEDKPVAHMWQSGKVSYPAQNLSTGFGDGLFDAGETKDFDIKARHTLVPLPKGTTEQDIKKKLMTCTAPIIYRILSNNPEDVISDKDRASIAQGFITKQQKLAKLILQDSEGNVYANFENDGTQLEGDDRIIGTVADGEIEITNKRAVLEYKRDIFSPVFKEDEDKREFKPSTSKKNVKATEELLQSEFSNKNVF